MEALRASATSGNPPATPPKPRGSMTVAPRTPPLRKTNDPAHVDDAFTRRQRTRQKTTLARRTTGFTSTDYHTNPTTPASIRRFTTAQLPYWDALSREIIVRRKKTAAVYPRRQQPDGKTRSQDGSATNPSTTTAAECVVPKSFTSFYGSVYRVWYCPAVWLPKGHHGKSSASNANNTWKSPLKNFLRLLQHNNRLLTQRPCRGEWGVPFKAIEKRSAGSCETRGNHQTDDGMTPIPLQATNLRRLQIPFDCKAVQTKRSNFGDRQTPPSICGTPRRANLT